jgi:hypothetical protein
MLRNKTQNVAAIVFIAGVAIIGVHILTSSHASTILPYASSTAASGSLTAPATLQTDSGASTGHDIVFGNLADPSGQNVPIGDQPGWHQVFYDNFANENVALGGFSGCSSTTRVCSGLPTALQSTWWDYPDGWLDTQKDCPYEPSQTMSIAGGIMDMYIHTASNGTCMTAVPEPKIPNAVGKDGGQLYGMYSVRMKSDPVPGYLTAFLLWPDSATPAWPQNGEIDFPNNNLNSTNITAYLHYEGAMTGGDQAIYNDPSANQSSWHTYTIQWAPTYVNFLVDGKTIGGYNSQTPGYSQAKIPDTAMHWVLQTESYIGTSPGTASNPIPPATTASGHLQVDWVSIWSYDPSAQ